MLLGVLQSMRGEMRWMVDTIWILCPTNNHFFMQVEAGDDRSPGSLLFMLVVEEGRCYWWLDAAIAGTGDADKLVRRGQELKCIRSQARGKSDAKIGFVVALLTLTSRCEENKSSDVGCNENWMLRLLAIGSGWQQGTWPTWTQTRRPLKHIGMMWYLCMVNGDVDNLVRQPW